MEEADKSKYAHLVTYKLSSAAPCNYTVLVIASSYAQALAKFLDSRKDKHEFWEKLIVSIHRHHTEPVVE